MCGREDLGCQGNMDQFCIMFSEDMQEIKYLPILSCYEAFGTSAIDNPWLWSDYFYKSCRPIMKWNEYGNCTMEMIDQATWLPTNDEDTVKALKIERLAQARSTSPKEALGKGLSLN